MPDGERYFCVARALSKGDARHNAPRRHFSIGLGCSILYAKDLIYSDGIDVNGAGGFVRIGVDCRTYPRLECGHRAHPLAEHHFRLDDNERPESLYARLL